MSDQQAAETTLRWLIEPFAHVLADPNMTNFYINGVGEGKAFADFGNGIEQFTVPLTLRQLENIALYAAAFDNQRISARQPLCMTKFPDGERVQIIVPPAVGETCISFSIRKPKKQTMTPAQLKATGTFDRTVDARKKRNSRTTRVSELIDKGEFCEATELAISLGWNVVFSGERDSGKSHCARSFTHAIPMEKRVITIEDMAEMINLPNLNVVHLFYSKGGQSIANVSPDDLVEATKRMGEGYIINQELRDDATYSYMDVLESGGRGMATTHARNARTTRSRIASLIKKHRAGMHQDRTEILRSLNRSIDLIAYFERLPDGSRKVMEMLCGPQDLSRMDYDDEEEMEMAA